MPKPGSDSSSLPYSNSEYALTCAIAIDGSLMRSRVKSFVHDWPDSTIRGCRQGLVYVEWVATEALRLYHRPTVNYRLVINDLDVDRFVISGLATMNEAAGAADAR